MKKTISIFIIFSLTSCQSTYKQIGEINMISNRNVSLKENYSVIKSYAGSGKKDLYKNKATNLHQAVDNLVKTIPGGEFVQNAKIYVIDAAYYSIEGDVYGIAENQNVKGFKKGDKIMWKDGFVKYKGTITDLKNNIEATVKQDENDKIRTVKYDDMNKIE